MKGLWKYISPFAPDQSGAAAVLYGLGGLVVICDAGGCAGNICGFDEPRWFSGGVSAVFSAGLRDMDAILGRDDRLVEKLKDAAEEIDGTFAAIVGTPVPSVIGTDYKGLARMAEKRLDLPVITVDTTGMVRYDKGVEKAYNALLQKFAKKDISVKEGTVNVLGNIPLELNRPGDVDAMVPMLQEKGYQDVRLFHDIHDYIYAGEAEKNIALSPAGLAAAKWLEKTFGTPYEMAYTDVTPVAEAITASVGTDENILIVHQAVAAHVLRQALEDRGFTHVTTATWFTPLPDDVALKEEDDFISLVRDGNFAAIAADTYFKRAVSTFAGAYIDFPHFAVSGRD